MVGRAAQAARAVKAGDGDEYARLNFHLAHNLICEATCLALGTVAIHLPKNS